MYIRHAMTQSLIVLFHGSSIVLCSMDFIKICTQLTGFFPYGSLGALKKIYEWTWLVILLLFPAISLLGAISIKSFKLGDIVTAVQGPAYAFRLSFCVAFFCLRKTRYLQILNEKREVSKWMKILAFKSDASITNLRNSSKTCTILTFFYFPCLISFISLFNLFFLPHLLLRSVANSPATNNLNSNFTFVKQKSQGSATSIEIAIVLSIVSCLFAFTAELKRRCVDFLIFEMYLHINQEINFLTETLTATFTERRAFFQKVNLSNWLKCKERLLR
jgi:hypothetical protein